VSYTCCESGPPIADVGHDSNRAAQTARLESYPTCAAVPHFFELLQRRIDPNLAMQRRTSLLGTLDEVDGQANNPIAVKP
jgi:hypothetical protein